MLLQNRTTQLPVVGPADPAVLQWPRTASSGRKLIVTTFGGSYFCLLLSTEFGSWFIPPPCCLTVVAMRSMTAAAARGHRCGIAENGKQLLRPAPALHIDLLAANAAR